ncbi:MAG: ornithine--oxo-acid transaminase [Fimbriimonadaceae bacterium]|nr:ornithine--oxo-acid transaminase [Fimbriimonadaceae bacterium]
MATTSKTLWEDVLSRGVQEVVAELSTEDAVRLSETYGTHNYKPLPVNVVRGDGVRVWTSEGEEYLDCIGAYSAVAHGHLSPFIMDTIRRQLDRVTVLSRAFYSSEVGLFLKAVCDFTELDMACPMNTEAEANETCIKLARKWGYTVKNVPLDQAEIIVCSDNFHGRTTTIVGFSSEDKYKKHFGPYGPGFKIIPFGDLEALKAAITPNTVAFLCEPIQAEGGILIPPDGWMTEVRRVCDENRVLLIWDEVQTGFCRTGRRFAWMHEPAAKPDLIAIGKAMGGGALPVSAAVGRREVMEVFQPGDHGSTFGGNPLGSVVAIAAMAEMEVKGYSERSAQLGDRLADRFRAFNFSCIKEVRARGLLVGLELDETVDSAAMTHALLAQRLLTKETRKRTFRFTPAISITEDQIDEMGDRVERALASL